MAARFAEADTKTDRVLGVSGALKNAETANRAQRRGGGKEATRRILGIQAAKRAEAVKEEVELTASEQVKLEFEEQEKFEAKFEEWKAKEDKGENEIFDHRDIWCFEGCFQLNRMLPHQIKEIGKRHLAASMNTNRGMPERVKSIIRWTLLPTTTYTDIVDFFNDHKSDKLPINLLEALMKGVMENDEVLAPMHYLLQPQFLSSQQARIAAFAIQKCVPHIPRRQYTNLLRAVLSGKRRNALKVTAYKQIIRMLVQRPSRTHIRMVVHEWDRNEVHRDVRIVMLQAAFDFIRAAKPLSFGCEASWHIFETAVTHPVIRKNIEIMTAIMGCTIEGRERNDDWYKDLVLKPRLLDHLATFKDTPIPKKHAARWAKIIVVLCDRVYTEWVDPNAKEEGKDAAKDEDEDGDVKINDEEDGGDETKMDVDGDGAETKKDKEEAEEEKKDEEKEDDGSGPYLKNEGKPRCLDDIAYIAMRSLEMWTTYNDSIVRDALRIVGETISDFNIDFIAHENEDVHKVNWARFDMACHILKITLKLHRSDKIRSKFLPVITDIVGRFDGIINAPLERFEDVYGYGEQSTFTISDKYAQSRDYITRVHKRLHSFFKKLGSFQNVPFEYYNTIISPLDSGSSRGMYTDIVMEKRWEMLSNRNTRQNAVYLDLCIDYIQDLLYYACLDTNFANAEVMKGCSNIMRTLNTKQRTNVVRILMKDAFPTRDEALYLPEILQSEQYTHLRQCMIKYMFDMSLIDGEVVKELANDFIEYFQAQMQRLADSMKTSTNSLWRKKELMLYSEINAELDSWLKFAIKIFRVENKYRDDAAMKYHYLALKFFATITDRASSLVDYDLKSNKKCSIEDWIYLQLFYKMLKSHMNHMVILYKNDLISLIKLPIFLAEKRFITNKENPFVNNFTVSQILDSMWSYLTSSYFYKDSVNRRYKLVSTLISWLMDPSKVSQRKFSSWRKGILEASIRCLTNNRYQKDAWQYTRGRFIKIWDMIAKEKCTVYLDAKDSDDMKVNDHGRKRKATKETDKVLLGNIACDMFGILVSVINYVRGLDQDYSNLKPLFNEILNRASDDEFYQRIFLRLVTDKSQLTTYLLHNKLQRIFDLAIEFTVDPPKDGRGGLSSRNISDLITSICKELSPRWSELKTLNHKARTLLEAIFKVFENGPKEKQSDLDDVAKIYRNVCIDLLRNHVQLIQYALTNKLANTLKYLLDLTQIHRNLTKRNPANICYDAAGSFPQILKSHIRTLNPDLHRRRTVDPISGAMICQIYKDATNKKSKNNELSCVLLYDFMDSITNLVTQAIFSPDLVKLISWAIDYATEKGLSVNNITNFIDTSSKYLSATFSTKRKIYPLNAEYYKLLTTEYCDWRKIYSKRTKTISEILSIIINNSNRVRWLITVSAQESINLIYAITLQYTLNQLTFNKATNLIMAWIRAIESEARGTYWKRINIDEFTQKQDPNQDNDEEKSRPSKKTKRAVAEIYKDRFLMPETLQIIHRIFQKDLSEPIVLRETQNAIWNDYMISIMKNIMDNYAAYLTRKNYLQITNTYLVSFVSYIAKTPLRFRQETQRHLVKYFKDDLSPPADEKKADHIMEWVKWMLSYRKEMNRAEQDVLTNLALALVVHFGHESCKKSKRIEHEILKEKTKDGANETEEDKGDTLMKNNDKNNQEETKSEASFESEADDVITWDPKWVECLNEFSNDENAVIRMKTRKIKTVFVDWEEHKSSVTVL